MKITMLLETLLNLNPISLQRFVSRWIREVKDAVGAYGSRIVFIDEISPRQPAGLEKKK